MNKETSDLWVHTCEAKYIEHIVRGGKKNKFLRGAKWVIGKFMLLRPIKALRMLPAPSLEKNATGITLSHGKIELVTGTKSA